MVVEVRMTRSKRAATKAAQGALNKTVLAQSDILHLILPQLDFASFVALRGTCRDIREGTQEVCEDLIQVLERAASLTSHRALPRVSHSLQITIPTSAGYCRYARAPVCGPHNAPRHHSWREP